MSIELLDKTRKINRMLLGSPTSAIPMEDISEVTGEVLRSNVVILNAEGIILGEYILADIEMLPELHVLRESIDASLNDRLLNVLSTKENVNLETLGITRDAARRYKSLLAPVEIAGRRLGTLFIYKNAGDREYGIDDIIFGEYMANIIALVLTQETVLEDAEAARRKKVVNAAFHTISLSEAEALLAVYQELEACGKNCGKTAGRGKRERSNPAKTSGEVSESGDGTDGSRMYGASQKNGTGNGKGETGAMEGLLVIGKIADRVGITRSVLVNALRKFESAGILETRSSGMKGTYVKVLIPESYDFLKRFE